MIVAWLLFANLVEIALGGLVMSVRPPEQWSNGIVEELAVASNGSRVPDCVEKLRLSDALAGDSIPLRQGRTGDDGSEASGANFR